MTEPRRLTRSEVETLLAMLRDPVVGPQMAEEARREQMVEVDNPFRREVRPRRGT